MKKKQFTQKLFLNKKNVALLNCDELGCLRGGGKTDAGETCLTDVVCCARANNLARQKLNGS